MKCGEVFCESYEMINKKIVDFSILLSVIISTVLFLNYLKLNPEGKKSFEYAADYRYINVAKSDSYQISKLDLAGRPYKQCVDISCIGDGGYIYFNPLNQIFTIELYSDQYIQFNMKGQVVRRILKSELFEFPDKNSILLVNKLNSNLLPKKFDINTKERRYNSKLRIVHYKKDNYLEKRCKNSPADIFTHKCDEWEGTAFYELLHNNETIKFSVSHIKELYSGWHPLSSAHLLFGLYTLPEKFNHLNVCFLFIDGNIYIVKKI